MSNERIDLQWLLEEDGLMQDLNWSIARFEQVEKLVKEMTAELKRCYDLIDAQKENLKFLNGAIEKLHEETWTEAVVEFVEEHHPSEWCDYSLCWKCEEETASE